MIRIALVAGLSIAAGAAATYFFLRGSTNNYIVLEAPLDTAAASAAPRAESLSTVLERGSVVSKRATVYGVAAQADEPALETMLEDAGDLEDSAARSLLIGALSLRAVELGADSALEMIRTLPLDAGQATDLGLLLLGEIGPSGASIEQIMGVLPQIERRRFQSEALVRWAQQAPERAYQEALALGDRQLKTLAVERVAGVWAERDLPAALAEAAVLPDDSVGRAFRAGVVRRLGAVDPAAMVAYVNGAPKHENALTQVVAEQLRLMEPTEALGWAEQLEGRLGENARRVALSSWAQEDPLAAFSYAQALPLGDERQQLMYAVANAYGREDPDAALAWSATLTQAPRDLRASVIAGIAQVDVRRALDLAFDADANRSYGSYSFARGRYDMLASVINNAMSSSVIPTQDLLARVLALRDVNERTNGLQIILSRWAREDAREAFEWIATEGNLPEDPGMLVNSLIRLDPVMAASYTERVPKEIRTLWLANVAQNYSRLDPQAALDWVGHFRNDEGYSAAIAAIAHQTIEYDPVMAANLIDSLDEKDQNTLGATEAVARGWAARDEQAARLWVRGLAEGALRDSALKGLIGSAYRDTIPDSSVLGLFSSQRARQQALIPIVYAVGRSDRAEARRLADEHITIPELRGQVESWLNRSEQRGVRVSPGGAFMTN
jgi:hypothetical protein